MVSIDENVYKLKEFGIYNDASAEARYYSNSTDIQSLIKHLRMQIIHIDEDEMEMEFDVIGIGPPIVNAVRRILLAEIPTMAIDKVHMYNNTTVIPDEVFAHRLGLVPIKVDPRPFLLKDPDGEETEEDTLKFELKVKCTRKVNASKEMPDETSCFNSRVYSRHLKFVPLGKQKDMYGDIRPVKEDILLAVLKPGHEIDVEAFCFKNIGREHAKFSPVVVASYRLMPQIRLLEEITGERAYTLAKVFPGIIKVSKKKDKEVAKIVNQRKILANRNIFLHDDLKHSVEVSKIKDHYIFTVESAGAIMPDLLVLEAINVLKDKCANFLKELKSLKV